jgi:hypothetical protein
MTTDTGQQIVRTLMTAQESVEKLNDIAAATFNLGGDDETLTAEGEMFISALEKIEDGMREIFKLSIRAN